jgi:hypothetical protein
MHIAKTGGQALSKKLPELFAGTNYLTFASQTTKDKEIEALFLSHREREEFKSLRAEKKGKEPRPVRSDLVMLYLKEEPYAARGALEPSFPNSLYSFTMLRSPFARVVSHWDHCYRNAQTCLRTPERRKCLSKQAHGNVMDVNVTFFLDSEQDVLENEDGVAPPCFTSNLHTWFLTCRCVPTEDDACDTKGSVSRQCPHSPQVHEHYQLTRQVDFAFATLRNDLAFFGIVEYWDASICLFLYTFRLPEFSNCGCRTSPWKESWNIHQASQDEFSEAPDLTTLEVRRALKAVAYDTDLYDRATRLFLQRIEYMEADTGVSILNC